MNAAKERPILFGAPMIRAILAGKKTQTRRVIKGDWIIEDRIDHDPWPWMPEYIDGGETPDDQRWAKCPYGVAGDLLWAKETWAYYPALVGGERYADHNDERVAVRYRATWDKRHSGPWRPSIYMPRWASRVTLHVTGVRAERVQDITEADAIAEGVVSVAEYKALWIEINGAESWERNDWVWVVTFDVKEIKR